ncbi:MAG: hypothetical protein JWN62_1233 [Acidimicrobiales bacterium]|nr:hypothetical protein [Acidimicrobiales bacterium]
MIDRFEIVDEEEGFTLVELLIVIVILGLLATVTVFAVRGITDKGTTSACSADKASLGTAAEAYFANYGGTTIPDATASQVSTEAALSPPVTITQTPAGTLVVLGLLRSMSTKYTVNANGSLTPILPCT